MNHIPTCGSVRLPRATLRPRRLCALLFLVLLVAVAACGIRPTSPPTQGLTSVPTIVTQSAIVCDSPAQPDPAGGCVVQDAATSVSLRVANAYADPIATVVQLETWNSSGYPLGIYEAQLALPSGRTFLAAGGASSGGPTSLTIYEPVPPASFAPLMHFVVTTQFSPQGSSGFGLAPGPTPIPTPAWLPELLRLTLSVPFALAPVRSGGYTYHQPPTVEQGIGAQVQWLQLAPAATAFYGPTGGASIELLFSGLPADMELLSFIRLESQNSIAGGTGGNFGPGLIQLQIPGMSVSTPAFTVLQHPLMPLDAPSVDPTVGAAGTVQLAISYQGSGVPTGQPAILSISQIQLLTGGIDGTTGAPTLPTYQITLPLS